MRLFCSLVVSLLQTHTAYLRSPYLATCIVCCTAAKPKKPQTSYPLSPAAPDAEEVSRFKFDTLSPDDAVGEAHKRATGSAEPSAVHQQPQQSGAASQPTQNEATASITNGELVGHRALMHDLLQIVLYALFHRIGNQTSVQHIVS